MENHIAIAEKYARETHDGHLTILRFTTGWKAVFGTPHVDAFGHDYHKVWALRTAASADEACADLLRREGLYWAGHHFSWTP